jgi:hypothetical protein
LSLVLEEAYPASLDNASLEVDEGRYNPEELEAKINCEEILDRALNLILTTI